MLRCILLGLALSAFALGSAVADDREEYTRINKLIQANEFDQAESGLAEALKEYPESRTLPRVHYSLYSAYRRASKMEQALPHLEAYVDALQAQTEQSAASASMFASYANLLISNLSGIEGRKEEAAKRLDGYIETLERLSQKPSAASVQSGLTALQARKIGMLIAADKKDAARTLLQSLVDAGDADLKKNSDDPAAAVRRMSTYKLQSQYASDLNPGQSEAIQKEYGEFVSAQIQNHPDDVSIARAFFSARMGVISSSARSDPESAKKLLKRTREEIETLTKESDALKKAAASGRWIRTLDSYASRIESEIKRLALELGELLVPANQIDLLARMLLTSLGFAAGLFVVPLQVCLQTRPPEDQKGRMIGTMNLVNWIGIVLSAGFYQLGLWLAPSAEIGGDTVVQVHWIFAALALLMLPVALWYRPQESADKS